VGATWPCSKAFSRSSGDTPRASRRSILEAASRRLKPEVSRAHRRMAELTFGIFFRQATWSLVLGVEGSLSDSL
jgi:hypothetical protein